MNFHDTELFVVLDKIEKTRGWGLYFEPGVDKGLCTKFILQLEEGKFINVYDKNINENNLVEYSYMEMTDKGKDFYHKLKLSDLW